MATIVLSSIGAAVGGAVGKVGATVGMAIGTYLGRSIDSKIASKSKANISGSRVHNISVQNSSYGICINKIFGEVRTSGNIIWADKIREHEHHHSTSVGGGKGGGGKATVSSTSYSYTISLAVAICEGEIDSVLNIWADSLLLQEGDFNIRIYNGSETQMPDPLMESYLGAGMVSAYRGLAYVVFEDLPLAKFGNRIPNFTFHTKRQAKGHDENVEDLVKGINIIPGSGEFVYDTKLQYLTNGFQSGEGLIQKGKNQVINLNNYQQKSDAELSLDQLLHTCPNLEWAAPIVCWFGTSLDGKQCQIKPGVESRSRNTYPEEWQVGDYNRKTAHQVTTDSENRPIYGGTTTDSAVLRYVRMLKSRGLKVMFYPMLMIDQHNKPWRGHLRCESSSVAEFFNNTRGYNNFITHYARLLKKEVDAFIIGSEMVSLTSVFDQKNQEFPAVKELVKLAEEVKSIVGKEVKVSYAADWTEYHKAPNSWYNMDELWSSDAIDFIGIDAYFPLTNTKDPPTVEEIREGWFSGEWYDYKYRDTRKTKKEFLPKSGSYKDIEWWWSNCHVNPDRSKSSWIPKSKKIWFTEYGFPSVDGSTNQPNVFFDNESMDGGLPVKSEGKVDFMAQRRAIKATELAWKDSEFLENKFLWTWDARPYPYWPRFANLWADSYKWSRGHWVNGKFGVTELAALISELCLKCGIPRENLIFENIDEIVTGYHLDDSKTALELLEDLKNAYFFEVIEVGNKLKFSKQIKASYTQILAEEIVSQEGIKIERSCEDQLYSSVKLIYINRENDFHASVVQEFDNKVTNDNILVIRNNLVCTQEEARKIAFKNLAESNHALNQYHFTLSPKYQDLEAGQVIDILYGDKHYTLKIKSLFINTNQTLTLTAQDYIHAAMPNFRYHDHHPTKEVQLKPEYQHLVFNSLVGSECKTYLAVWSRNTSFKPVSLYVSDNDEDYRFIQSISSESYIGSLLEPISEAEPGLVDLENELIISMIHGQLESISYEELLSGKNKLYINGEVIQFMNAILIGSNMYKLSVLLRGCDYTEHEVKDHIAGSDVVFINPQLECFDVPKNISSKQVYYKLAEEGTNLLHAQTYRKDLSSSTGYCPSIVNLRAKEEGGICHINWTNRSQEDGFWEDDVITMDSKQPVFITISENDNKIIEEVVYSEQYKFKINLQNRYFIKINSLTADGRLGFSRSVSL
ncbi:MAG: glycoside hydrolase TIM-barrel-like domain-containing protein [Rickettsiales bacterium]